MKAEKYTLASARQLRRLAQFGLVPDRTLTQHRASQLLNNAVSALQLKRGERLSSIFPLDIATGSHE